MKKLKIPYAMILASMSIIMGSFLVIDRLFIHAIGFDYAKIGLGWLDPYIDHWMWGILFIFFGLMVLIRGRKR